jgi:hypothetical protein
MSDTEQALQQLLQQEGQRLYADGHAIVENGRERHGASTMDTAIADLTEALGDAGVNQLVSLARGYNQPADLIVHLSNNPDRLKRLARMTPEEANVELARIESQMSPHGRPQSGKEPAWRQSVANKGNTTEEQWRRDYGSDISDDQEWSRRWDRRELRKMGKSE